MVDESVVGKLGTVTHPIRQGRPGEICVKIRGGSETFMAYAEKEIDIALGGSVLVIGQRSPRSVDVCPFDE